MCGARLSALAYLLAVCAQAQDTGTITGIVVDNADRPAVGATVYAIRNRAAGEQTPVHHLLPSQTTNEDGSFSIQNLGFGTYSLYTADIKDGYPNTWLGIYRDGLPEPTKVTLSATASTAHAKLSLGSKAGTIAVSTFDVTTGLPVKGTAFSIWRIKTPGQWLSGQNMYGTQLIPPNEKIGLAVMAPGYQTWYYPGSPVVSDLKPVILKSGETMTLQVYMFPAPEPEEK
jgi:hypothetical protein